MSKTNRPAQSKPGFAANPAPSGLMRRLEPRFMFDGAAGITIAAALTPDHAPEPAPVAAPHIEQHAELVAVQPGLHGVEHTACAPEAPGAESSVPVMHDILEAWAASAAKPASETPTKDTGSKATDDGRVICQFPLVVEPVAAIVKTLPPAEEPAGHPPRNSVVFIDSSVADQAALLASLPANSDVVQIAAGQDGVSQIAAYLAGRTGVSAIHIISHGTDGDIALGSTHLNSSTIAAHAADLAVIKAALTADADILLYGCDVAATAKGQAFIAELSHATGADIAASTDVTGAAKFGGNWTLEAHTGSIEASAIFAPDWDHELAPLVISTNTAPIINPGTANQGVFTGVGTVVTWKNAGTVGGVAIDLTATVVSYTGTTNPTFHIGGTSSGTAGDNLGVFLHSISNMTLEFEVFEAGTHNKATGSPDIRVTDIDGIGGFARTRETVTPGLDGLTAYTVSSPSNIAISVSSTGVEASGTQDQNGEPSSLAGFQWQNVSSWTIKFEGKTAASYFSLDGNGQFAFTKPVTTYLLGIDLDGNNSTAAGTAYTASYAPNSAGIAVVDTDVVITQSTALGTNLGHATVTLVNAQADDVLSVAGLPSSISATIDTSVAGQISVKLSGVASLADYQTALKAIEFANGSATASTTDRHIEVSVTNATHGTTSNTALSTIHVTAPVVQLVAVDDTATIGLNGIGNGTVASNDSGAPGDTLTYAIATGPAHGAVRLLSDGRYLYSPDAGYSGPDSLTYTVSNGHGGTATATLAITVDDPNDPPAVNLNSGAVSGLAYAAAWQHTASNTQPNSFSAYTSAASSEAAGPGLTHVVSGSAAYVSGVQATSYLQAVENNEYLQYSFTTNPAVDSGVYISGFARNNNGYTGKVAFQLATQADFSDAQTMSQGDALGTSGYVFFDRHTPLDPNTTYYVRVYFYDTPGTQRWDDFGVLLNRANPDYAATFTEGGAAVHAADMGLADVSDIGENDIVSLTIDGANFVDGANEKLVIGGHTFVLDTSATVTLTIGATPLTIAYDSATQGFAITRSGGGIMAQADLDTLVRGITYENTSGNPTGGSDRTLTVTAIDSANQASVPAVSTLTVIPVDDPPVVTGESVTIAEDATLTADAAHGLLVNDTDVDGGALTIKAYTLAGVNGTFAPGQTAIIADVGALTINADGSYVFVPAADYNGTVPVATYTVSDGHGGLTNGAFAIAVTPVADIVADSVVAQMNTTLTFNALTGTGGASADTFEGKPSVSAVSTPAHGSVSFSADGTIVYAPATDYHGADSFTYTVTSPTGVTETATVTVFVNAPPEVVVSLGDKSGLDGSAVAIITKGAFADPDGQALTFSATGLPAGLAIDPTTGKITGTLTRDASVGGPAAHGEYDVAVTVTDPAGASVTDHFTFRANNVAPVAKDDAIGTLEDTPIVFDVRGNDHDGGADSDPLAVTMVDGKPLVAGGDPVTVANGQVSLGGDGRLTFRPAADFNGTATFAYTIADGQGGTATANAVITVTAVNDPPVAVNDTATLTEDNAAISGNVITGPGTDTDVDGGALSVIGVKTSSGAVIAVGTATKLPEGGTLTLRADGSYSFDPGQDFQSLAAGEVKTVVVHYTIDDGHGGTASADLTITVSGVNDAPVVIDPATGKPPVDPVTLLPLDPLTAPIIPGVSAEDGSPITPVTVGSYFKDVDTSQGPPKLTVDTSALPPGVTFNPSTGTFSGTPTRDASQGHTGSDPAGTYKVPVTATDPAGATVTTYVTFTIANPPPVARDDVAKTDQGQPVTIDVLANDHDGGKDGDRLSVVAAASPNGQVTIGADGRITFTPDRYFAGVAKIVYAISDGNGGFATAEGLVTVKPEHALNVTQRSAVGQALAPDAQPGAPAASIDPHAIDRPENLYVHHVVASADRAIDVQYQTVEYIRHVVEGQDQQIDRHYGAGQRAEPVRSGLGLPGLPAAASTGIDAAAPERGGIDELMSDLDRSSELRTDHQRAAVLPVSVTGWLDADRPRVLLGQQLKSFRDHSGVSTLRLFDDLDQAAGHPVREAAE